MTNDNIISKTSTETIIRKADGHLYLCKKGGEYKIGHVYAPNAIPDVLARLYKRAHLEVRGCAIALTIGKISAVQDPEAAKAVLAAPVYIDPLDALKPVGTDEYLANHAAIVNYDYESNRAIYSGSSVGPRSVRPTEIEPSDDIKAWLKVREDETARSIALKDGLAAAAKYLDDRKQADINHFLAID